MKKLMTTAFLLFSLGLMALTRTELRISELPKPVTDYISKYYAAYSVSKAFKSDNRGTITYEVCISQGKKNIKLVFDKDSKFLREEACSDDSMKNGSTSSAVKKH